VGLEHTLKVDSARLLALVGEVEPFVHTAARAQARQFNRGDTNLIAGGDILIHALNLQVITNVLDINLPHFVPLGLLASTVQNLGLVSLIAHLQLAVGVHLREHLSVTSEVGLNNVELKFAGSSHLIA